MKEKGKKNQLLDEQQLKQALIKKALGYDATEVVEEYVGGEEGQIILHKKKVTKKNVPPDIMAIKMLFNSQVTPISSMTDQELELEKERLLCLLSGEEKN